MEAAQPDLSGKSALVVGASGGLGRAIAIELDARGANLTIAGRDADRLAAVPITAHRVLADLRTPEACAHVVGEAVRANGPIDILVNAVGIVAFGGVDELGIDAMEDLFLTNTFVPIMLVKAALGAGSSGAGSSGAGSSGAGSSGAGSSEAGSSEGLAAEATIVQMSGVIAEQNLPGMAAYGASKAALRSFDEAMTRELRRRKIRTIDARPPHTETGLADHPIEGAAPTMPSGLEPALVARVIVDAVAGTTRDLPSEVFTNAAKESTGQ